jgi:DNA modification methylase
MRLCCESCGNAWKAEPAGGHRLVCGDSSDGEAVAAAIDARADVCLTDPPYGIGDTASAKNDYETYDDTRENLVRLIAGFFPLAQRSAKCVVLTPGNANVRLYPEPTWTMAWFTPAGVGSGPWGFCCWQPVLCFGADPKLAAGKGRHPDALVHTEAADEVAHPCSKPVNFWSWLMERVSEPGALVFDPFCGSGTGLIAAEKSGRRLCGIELNPAYVDVSVARWQKFTGRVAVREADGALFSDVADAA